MQESERKKASSLLFEIPWKKIAHLSLIIMVFTGFISILWIKSRLSKTFEVNPLTETPVLLLVQENYNTGPLLTQKVTCFLCETTHHGKMWNDLVHNESCQKGMFHQCFRNFTKFKRSSTKVASIVRRCSYLDCECNQESRDWCMTSECGVDLVCCEEQYIQCSQILKHWFYTYFGKE